MAGLADTYAGTYLGGSIAAQSGDTNDPLVQAVKAVPARWIGLFFQNFQHSLATTGKRLLQDTPPRAKVPSMRPEYAAELGITLTGMHVADNWRVTVDRQRLTQSDANGDDVWAQQGQAVVIAEITNPHPGALMLFQGSQKMAWTQTPRFNKRGENNKTGRAMMANIVGRENFGEADRYAFAWTHFQVHPSREFRQALDSVLARLLKDTPFGKPVDAAPQALTTTYDLDL